MRQMIKSGAVLLLVGILLTGGLLTGCGQRERFEIEDEPETVDLTFFGFKVGQTQSEVLEELIGSFEKENPGVHINYEGLGNADGYLDVLYKRIDSGEADDLFMLNPFAFPVAREKGYIGTDIYDLKDEAFLDQYNDTIRTLLDVDGHVLAVPMEAGAIGLLSNTDMLDRYGLDVPDDYAGFLDCCETLKAHGVMPVAISLDNGSYTSGHIFAFARALGDVDLDSIDYEALRSGKQSLGGMLRSGLEMVDEFSRKGYWQLTSSADSADWSADMEHFVHEDAAFMAAGSWQIQRIELEEPSFKYEFTGLPLCDEGNVAVIRASSPICANAKGEHLDLALRFLEYISQREHVEAFTASQTALSPLKNGAEPTAALENINQAVQEKRVITDSDPRFPVDLVTELREMSKAVASGKMSVDDASAYLDSLSVGP